MTKTAPGPKELHLRALREEKAAKKHVIGRAKKAKIRLVPFAGSAPLVRGGKGSPNQPKPKDDPR